MATYDGYERVFTTKTGKVIDEAESKSKKSLSSEYWSDLTTKRLESAKKGGKTLEKRQLDKMAKFAHNYGSNKHIAEIETVTVDSDTNRHYKFKSGDRVVLTYDYIPTKEYPVWGSRRECVGTVYGMQDGATRVMVEWDNGAAHSYPTGRVSMYNTRLLPNDPNLAFKRRKNKKYRSKRSIDD